MAAEPQPTARERWLALGLLLGLLALLWLSLVHPLWVRPLLEQSRRIDALQQRQARANAELAQAPRVQQALGEVRASLATRPGFLPEASAELATAGLIQRMEELVQQVSPGNRSCTISNRSPLALPADNRTAYPRVAVQLRLRCGMPETAALLHALEGGVPRLFVENLTIIGPQALGEAVQADGGGGLDVNFDLYGYLAPASAEVAHAP
ncbi:MAG: type II secretion system protein GspM [Pseudoxanthomonas suwonensis]|nr:type II secretion system protein GspM [Pseudoxanthomonas suwonensis]